MCGSRKEIFRLVLHPPTSNGVTCCTCYLGSPSAMSIPQGQQVWVTRCRNVSKSRREISGRIHVHWLFIPLLDNGVIWCKCDQRSSSAMSTPPGHQMQCLHLRSPGAMPTPQVTRCNAYTSGSPGAGILVGLGERYSVESELVTFMYIGSSSSCWGAGFIISSNLFTKSANVGLNVGLRFQHEYITWYLQKNKQRFC